MTGPRALATLALLAATAAAPLAAAILPLAGAEPLGEVAVLENPALVLPRWVGSGRRAATLLLVGDRAGLFPLGERESAALRALPDAAALAREGDRGGTGLYHGGNFARAAHALGVARDAIWVLPALPPGGDDTVEAFRGRLVGSGYTEADATSFAAEGRCYRGSAGGMPVLACALEDLPPAAGPVLLHVDAASLPMMSAVRGRSLLSGVRDLLLALAARRYPTADAVVAYSVEEGVLPVDLRWIGDALVALLRDPAPLAFATPPAPWWQIQDAMRQLGGGERHAEMPVMDKLLRLHDDHPGSAALHFLMARSYLRLGAEERALETGEDACRIDPGYCFGLEDLGLQLLERGRPDSAEVFFAAGARLRPGMRFALLDKALGLARAGRVEAALAALTVQIERNGPLPAAFVAGALLARQGDRAGARRRFDEALAQLARVPAGVAIPGFAAGRTEIAMAAAYAARFYREEGLAAEAARLEGDLRLGLPPAGEGP